jgi:hypothetical protein
MRNFLQHVLNPLHVYCRLRNIGLTPTSAQRVCRVYERFVYRLVLS